MTIQSFEYCSLHYLNQWLTYDRGYCDALSNGTTETKLNTLKNAGGFYRVSRNLPTKYDVGKGRARYQPTLDILDQVDKKKLTIEPVIEINKIERKISAVYGDRNVLSLTTKFLWLKVKKPIIIYDSQARSAIGTTILQQYLQKNGFMNGFLISIYGVKVMMPNK